MTDADGQVDLGALSLEQVGQVMLDRLHGHQSLGPALDPYGDTPPYLWLVDEYGVGSDRLCSWMARIAEEFAADMTDTEAWPPEARENLLDLAQECGLARKAVARLIDTKALLDHPRGGQEAHAALLKCSLEQVDRRSVPFWLEQLKVLGDDYGALIFGGLLEHGLQTAAAHLADCCASDEAVANMSLVIPALVARYGLDEVVEELQGPLAQLPDPAGNELTRALQLEGSDAPSWQDATPAKTWGRPKAAAIAGDLVVRRAA